MKVTCQISMRGKLFLALRPDVFLQILQFCLVADDSGSDTENVSSRIRREFDGGSIAHAAGDGGCGAGWYCTTSFDAHPATSSKAALQISIPGLCIS